MQALASNDGSMGGMMGAGIGIMAMGPMGQNLTQVVDDMFDPNAAKKNGADPFPDASSSGIPQPFGLHADPSGHVDVSSMFNSVVDGSLGSIIAPETGSTEQPKQATEPIAAPLQSGQPAGESADFDMKAKLRKLKELLEEDLISQEDFETKKDELLKLFLESR